MQSTTNLIQNKEQNNTYTEIQQIHHFEETKLLIPPLKNWRALSSFTEITLQSFSTANLFNKSI